jgi:Domain of unknown function (DUF4149)
MTTLLRILRLYPLALWVGGEVFFVIVAAIAFSVLPDAHTAGLVVRSALIDLHRIGMGAGVVYLLATVALMATTRERHRVRLMEILLVAMMLVFTLYSQDSVIPQMEKDRMSLGGDIASAPAQNSARLEFEHLHQRSVNLEAAVLVGGLILIALAPIEDRNRVRGIST